MVRFLALTVIFVFSCVNATSASIDSHDSVDFEELKHSLNQTNSPKISKVEILTPLSCDNSENIDHVSPHEAALIRSTRDSLSLLIQRLNGFIYDDEFDVVNFSNQAKSLSSELSQTTHWVEVAHFENKGILRQLSFAKRMFGSMLEAAKITSIYATDGPGKDLVCQLIRLNVRLYALYDYRGLPDIHQDAYIHTLNGYILKLDMLEEQFRKLGKVPAIVNFMFTSQKEQARRRLESLEGYATRA